MAHPMNNEISSRGRFDNVAIRTRENRCVVSTACPPFRAVYWPDLRAVAAELGFAKLTPGSLESWESREAFLTHLAERLGVAFRPARVGFRSSPDEIQRRELFRRQYQAVAFAGPCSRGVVMGALEVVTGGVRRGGAVDVRLSGWDSIADWGRGREMVNDICGYLHHSRHRAGNVTLFSTLASFEPDLWTFIYDRCEALKRRRD